MPSDTPVVMLVSSESFSVLWCMYITGCVIGESLNIYYLFQGSQIIFYPPAIHCPTWKKLAVSIKVFFAVVSFYN